MHNLKAKFHKIFGGRPFFKIFALQFAAAALIFCMLLIFKSTSAPAVQESHKNFVRAFIYGTPANENDDDIGKIKFVGIW